jgi:hypothetical protein
MYGMEVLQQAIHVASRLGYGVRHEWLGGCAGGACEIGGRKWIFIDLALGPCEQLEQVVTALRSDPGIYLVELPAPLRDMLDIRRAA